MFACHGGFGGEFQFVVEMEVVVRLVRGKERLESVEDEKEKRMGDE